VDTSLSGVGVARVLDAVIAERGQAPEAIVMDRHDCLNDHWFTSLYDARQKVETWRQDFNTVRPTSRSET